MTVVRRQAWRRWAVVGTAAALLCALPVAVRAWPARAGRVDVEALRTRMLASAGQPYQGYALSSGTLVLPDLPQLGDVTSLLVGTTQLRAWYADRDRWRVDVVGTGTERGLYAGPDGRYVWDYAANQLTRVVGEQPVRLPRAADLVPPDLARRLLAGTAGDRLTPLPARRVAGVTATGLRVSTHDPNTTVARVDVWADPATGLPLQVEVAARRGQRPVLVSRFLEVSTAAPDPAVLAPPVPGPGVGSVVTRTPDVVSALERLGRGSLPDRLAGQPRGGAPGELSTVGVYGTGLARFAVLAVPWRIGYEAYRSSVGFGRRLSFAGGDGGLITTPLLSVLVVNAGGRTFVLAGLVDGGLLERAGAELAGLQS